MADPQSPATMQITMLTEWGGSLEYAAQTITLSQFPDHVRVTAGYMDLVRHDMEEVHRHQENVPKESTSAADTLCTLYETARELGNELFGLCRDRRPLSVPEVPTLCRAVAKACLEFCCQAWLLIASLATTSRARQSALGVATRRITGAAEFATTSLLRLEQRQRRHTSEMALRVSNIEREKAQMEHDLEELQKGQRKLETDRQQDRENRRQMAVKIAHRVHEKIHEGTSSNPDTILDEQDLMDLEIVERRIISNMPPPPPPVSVRSISTVPTERSASIEIRGPSPRKRKLPPPPDSSSSGDSDSDHGSDRRRYQRFLDFERRQEKGKGSKHRRRRSRSRSPPAVRITASKPKMNQPEKFSGSRREDFRLWFRTVEDHLEYCAGQFSTDTQKILWLGSFLTGKAQIWFQDRRTQALKERSIDDWRRFRRALKDRFIDTHEIFKADLKLEQLEYKQDISHYLAQFRSMNQHVGLQGAPLRNRILRHMPSRVRERMSMFPRLPEDDEDFLQRLEEVARTDEDFAQEEKLMSTVRPANRGEGGKDTKSRAWTKSTSKAEQSSTQQSREVVHTDRDAALKGIPESLIRSRETKSQCLRCGMNNHQFRYCFKPINPSSTNPKKVAAMSKKRQTRESSSDSNDSDHAPASKKTKSSKSHHRGEERTRKKVEEKKRVPASEKATTGRIYEMDTEDEEEK